MAGHSKWANIQHRKGREDSRRAKMFTKYGREITVSARMGGGDPDANPRLRSAINEARKNSMPNDNINRAIERGAGSGDASQLDEMVFEGYGPGGVAMLVEVLTDNKARTTPEIRHLFSKLGGNMSEAGSVSWQFTKRGYVQIPKAGLKEEALAESVIEAGGEDYEDEGEFWGVLTAADELHAVREELEGRGHEIESAKLIMTPDNEIQAEGEILTGLMRLMEGFDDHDDVQNVWTNADFDESSVQ